MITPLPVSPIENLIVQYRNVMHLPDPGPLYVLMGAVAGNMIEGAPCWLMMVGAPSCGKSELLNSLLAVPHMVEAADISGEAAFLSGCAAKDISKNATGGLLCEIGDAGGLIINDLTSILSKHDEKISAIMAVFRETYGGRWTRHLGSEGGRTLNWTGRLAVFAGCTNVVDQRHETASGMGERWIFYRFEQREGDEQWASVDLSVTASRPPRWRETLNAIAAQFFQDLNLSFRQQLPRRMLTNLERIRIHRLSVVAARCRSSVPRDRYSKEIIATPEAEMAVRLATALAQLYLGMDAIGVSKARAWKLLTKVAMDSMPKLRYVLIQAIAAQPHSLEELQARLGCNLNVVKRTAEDLEFHGVIRQENGKVRLTDWMQDKYRKLMATAAPVSAMY